MTPPILRHSRSSGELTIAAIPPDDVRQPGATAIERFTRPVCYQNVPDARLPESLQGCNPLGIWRLRDGELAKA
jgi:hypothetical protein